jgi:hypothetical protein
MERLAKFGLLLHVDKTRLIMFALFVRLRALQHVHDSKRLHLHPEASGGKSGCFSVISSVQIVCSQFNAVPSYPAG